MLRRASLLVSNFKHGKFITISARSKTTIAEATPEDIAACRQWLSKFSPDTIPKRLCELSFSRSSGPGGQNVNKVSSKATLRLPMDYLTPILPSLLHQPIRQSRYYAAKSDSIVIQADDSRKQADNANECFVKLHHMVAEAGTRVLPGETSVEQKARVKALQKRENENRLKMKKTHSNKKASRRSGDGE